MLLLSCSECGKTFPEGTHMVVVTVEKKGKHNSGRVCQGCYNSIMNENKENSNLLLG